MVFNFFRTVYKSFQKGSDSFLNKISYLKIMSLVKINNMIKLSALCLLNNGPKHGYELIKEVGIKLNKNISASHIYPFLKELQENSFVNCNIVGKREQKKYELTTEGKHFVTNTLDDFQSIIKITNKPKIKVCTHCGYKVTHINKESLNKISISN